jgi:hypothetical protein
MSPWPYLLARPLLIVLLLREVELKAESPFSQRRLKRRETRLSHKTPLEAVRNRFKWIARPHPLILLLSTQFTLLHDGPKGFFSLGDGTLSFSEIFAPDDSVFLNCGSPTFEIHAI